MKSREPSWQTVAYCMSVIHNCWDVLFLLPLSFVPMLFCSCSRGKPKCCCCETSLSARANLCSVQELYRERQPSSQLVAEIHFNAFRQTHNVKIKRASSFGFMWPPLPACRLWVMQNFVLCSHAGISFSPCLNPPPHTVSTSVFKYDGTQVPSPFKCDGN